MTTQSLLTGFLRAAASSSACNRRSLRRTQVSCKSVHKTSLSLSLSLSDSLTHLYRCAYAAVKRWQPGGFSAHHCALTFGCISSGISDGILRKRQSEAERRRDTRRERQRDPERPRETQRDAERDRGTQRDVERRRETQRDRPLHGVRKVDHRWLGGAILPCSWACEVPAPHDIAYKGETERQRQRDRNRETEAERQRQRQRNRKTERQRQRYTARGSCTHEAY